MMWQHSSIFVNNCFIETKFDQCMNYVMIFDIIK